MPKNQTYWVVVRQPEGDPEYFDWSTRSGTPAYAIEMADWREANEINEAYWKANPRVRIAKVAVAEIESLPTRGF